MIVLLVNYGHTVNQNESIENDLSYQKNATQSTTYPAWYNLYDAGNAVDRNITTCMRTEQIGTNSPDKTVWWKVDLGGVYNIYSVNIFFKNYNGSEMRQRRRFAGFSLYLSHNGDMDHTSLCYKDGPDLPPLNFTTTCFRSARYVTFYNERLDGVTYPSEYEVSYNVFTELCEVFVYGCNRIGMYGSNCDVPCPTNCRYSACHILNGTFFGCKPGWTGISCNQKCNTGWYGEDCKQQCVGHCRNSIICNHVTGLCDDGCADGWRGSLCNVRQIDLSFSKTVTQSTTSSGTYHLYKAGNAVDRNITTCMRTKEIGSNSPDKTVWWKVDLGGVYNIYSVNILFKNYDGYELRQRGRFAGFSIYVSITGSIIGSSLCYKDGPSLPSLNFTTTCNIFGRYVIFYNERVHSISYPTNYIISSVITELCEVIVYGCNTSGVYGDKCDLQCPTKCKNNTCNIYDGTCLSCEPGWTGIHCNKICEYGVYGQHCKHQCGESCENKTCNHVTGHCDRGCVAGWTGPFCDEECVRSYGENCKFPCGPHCFDQRCDRFNGNCLTGCTNDFYGEKCDKYVFKNHAIDSSASNCSWDIGGPISLTINVIFLIGVFLCIWSVYTKKFAITFNMRKIVKNNLYAEAEATTDNASHYQELGTPERSTYQNTTLR